MGCATRWWSATFSGWSDAGNAASAAVEHLAEAYQAELAYELDPDEFYDYQVNRPEVALNADGEREITWPTTRIKTAQLAGGRDLILVEGIEPNLRWRQFGGLITSALRSANPSRVFVLGALLADTPHTRPVPVTTTTRDPDLMEAYGIGESTYEGPTGIVGVMADLLARSGLPTMSVWAAIPHYVSHPPCPKATLAILSQLERLLDVPLDFGELPELARAWERGVNELAAEDTEVAEYVPSWRSSRTPPSCPRPAATRSRPSSSATCKRRRGLERLCCRRSLFAARLTDSVFLPHSQTKSVSARSSVQTESGAPFSAARDGLRTQLAASASRRSSATIASGSSAPNTAEPATNESAPAAAQRSIVSTETPPSTCSQMSPPVFASSARVRSILGRHRSRNFCPPKPGSTVMISTRSSSGSSSAYGSIGVAGFSAIPARAPGRGARGPTGPARPRPRHGR